MNLAFYGTLRDSDILERVLGNAALPGPKAVVSVKGYACWKIEGQAYPLLRSEPEAITTFDLYHDIAEDSWRRLVEYEGDEYFPGLIRIQGRDYHVFLAHDLVKACNEIWTLESFQTFDKESYLRGLQ